MPTPIGRYTPRSGPLAGRSFASYFQYQQARAQALGFTSYSAERAMKRQPMFQALFQRAVDAGMLRNRAISDVGQFMRQNPVKGGMRKHNAIKYAIDNGWVDDYDEDDDDWAPY